MTAHPSATVVDAHRQKLRAAGFEVAELLPADIPDYVELEIGRASCRERV